MTLLVAITGGSGSGKSTLAEGLAAALPSGAARLLSEDWYYRDCSAFADFDPATFDFDDIAIRDHDLLIAHLKALKAGQSVDAPAYDFATHSRTAAAGHRVEPAQVVIAEGTHLLCSAPVAELFDLRIYLDTPDDIRFIRRFLRDQAHRARTPRSIIDQYLTTVRPAHVRLTDSARARAHVVVRDQSTTVDRPDPAAVAALVRPLLQHAVFAGVHLSQNGSAAPRRQATPNDRCSPSGGAVGEAD
jgi:uridine kinase